VNVLVASLHRLNQIAMEVVYNGKKRACTEVVVPGFYSAGVRFADFRLDLIPVL
jgi:hypothetical protein